MTGSERGRHARKELRSSTQGTARKQDPQSYGYKDLSSADELVSLEEDLRSRKKCSAPKPWWEPSETPSRGPRNTNFSSFQEQQCWGTTLPVSQYLLGRCMVLIIFLSRFIFFHINQEFPANVQTFYLMISRNGDFIPIRTFTLKNASGAKAYFIERIIFQNGYGFIFL